jgi:GTPase KRas protein
MDMRDGWIAEGDAFILVYSVSSRSSFTPIQALHDYIQRAQAPSHSQLPSALRSAPVQIMIVANKTDQTRVVSAEEGRLLAEQLGCQFVETCAKYCSNLEPACSSLIRQMRHDQAKTVICDRKSRGCKVCLCFRVLRSHF